MRQVFTTMLKLTNVQLLKRMHVIHPFTFFAAKQPSLKLKTQSTQLLGYLPCAEYSWTEEQGKTDTEEERERKEEIEGERKRKK
jgi:hypothetical protein